MQQKLFDMLMKEDELNWKAIIYDMVKSEQMDPWDIDIALLARRFIETIKKMQEQDFKIPGKILLAAALMLRIKATYLIENDISNLDRMLSQAEEEALEDELFQELREIAGVAFREKEKFRLIPKNPQPRSRKVSIHDLIDALQVAMSTKKKILARQRPVKFHHDFTKKIDILEAIRDIYHKINFYSKKDKNSQLTFTKLLPPQAGKIEKVYTYVPLLHLEHEQKIETRQKKHFDEIYIKLLDKKDK